MGVRSIPDTGLELKLLSQTGAFPGRESDKIQRKLSVLFWACAFLCVLTYVLISIGGVVRNTGSGLACPDWPLCYGQLVPSELKTSSQVFIEWFHRLVAGVLGVLVVGITFFVFKDSDWRKKFGRTTVILLALLFTQAFLGGLTVLGMLSPHWVVLHLATGLLFFSALLMFLVKIKETIHLITNYKIKSWFKFFAYFTVFLVYCQALLGGVVSSHYAGLACPDFPTCYGKWLPPLFEGPLLFQFLHRTGALLTTIVVVVFSFISLWQSLPSLSRFCMRLVPLFLAFQILIGGSMVFLKLPALLSVLHLALATALLGLLFVTAFEVRHA